MDAIARTLIEEFSDLSDTAQVTLVLLRLLLAAVLGAGAIIKNASEEQIQGLTTAAGIFMTAAIGVACGLGREATAVLSTLLALLALAIVPKFEDRRRR